MILIGRYLSPFVRRCATTLELYGMDFENRPLQHTGDDAPVLRESNPVGRVPALVLSDGEVIIDSAAILDYLDRAAGPAKSLMPSDGKDRNRALNLLGVATGAVEKAIATVYEVRFRPEEKRHAPWVERCADQARGGFEFLNSQLDGNHFIGDNMTQADVTAAITWQFVGLAANDLKATINAPALDGLVDRMMALPAFQNTMPS
ncbi:MAG: glutathione S-transferase family protein [Pseudomonadota bacterium]